MVSWVLDQTKHKVRDYPEKRFRRRREVWRGCSSLLRQNMSLNTQGDRVFFGHLYLGTSEFFN